MTHWLISTQVTKLVTGVGVDYHRWPAGVVFRKGEPVTLQDDLVQIKEDAKDFEAQHGRDLGNGWLLNHPLEKMILFRDHLAATKLPGKARKKTKAVPRAPPSDDDDDDEAAAAPQRPPTGKLDKATVQALRDVKKRFDEGKLDEATYKETKAGQIDAARALLARSATLKWRTHAMKALFKRWLRFEQQHGDASTVASVKDKAREYVASLTQ